VVEVGGGGRGKGKGLEKGRNRREINGWLVRWGER